MTSLAGAERIETSTHIGTEFRGLKLASLSDDEIDEIRQLVAERGVLFFRDQDMTIVEQGEFGQRLGDLHINPTKTNYAEDFPGVGIMHVDANSKRVPGDGWHTDMSCDERPPALSMLRIEVTPPLGGDTMFASMYRAYETLSEPMREFLLGLTGIHTGDRYRERQAGAKGKEIPDMEHPVVRTHPDTGRKALFVNTLFTKRIKELQPREGDALLRMLFDHIAYDVTSQIRFRWEPNSVALWDNRCVQHHAIWDYFPETRHGYRLTTAGEKPYQ
jgi:taurine dioxygenase